MVAEDCSVSVAGEVAHENFEGFEGLEGGNLEPRDLRVSMR
jgi:hypothetical protein